MSAAAPRRRESAAAADAAAQPLSRRGAPRRALRQRLRALRVLCAAQLRRRCLSLREAAIARRCRCASAPLSASVMR